MVKMMKMKDVAHEPGEDQLTPPESFTAAVPSRTRSGLYIFAVKVVALGFTSVTLCGSLWLADSLDGQISPLVSYGFYGGALAVALGGMMMLLSWFYGPHSPPGPGEG